MDIGPGTLDHPSNCSPVPKRFMTTSISLPFCLLQIPAQSDSDLAPPQPQHPPLLKSVPPSSALLTRSRLYLLCFVQLLLQELGSLLTDLHRGAAETGDVALLSGLALIPRSSILAPSLWLLLAAFGWHQRLPVSHSWFLLAVFLQMGLAAGDQHSQTLCRGLSANLPG